MVVKIVPNDKGNPPGKLADAELHFEAQRAVTEGLQRRHNVVCPHVFHRDGEPIKCFRKAWVGACEDAGVPGRIFHDLRRTAVRNVERAGHKTEAVYRRYAIVSDADLREAAQKLAAMTATGTITGTVKPARRKANAKPVAQRIELMAEGEGFEPPRASRPGGFQVHCLAS